MRRGLPRANALWRRAPVRTPYASPLPYARAGPAPYKSGTLRCRHNLAFSLGRIGRAEESYRTAREVAETRTRVLGPDHPDTLVTRYEVAYALGQSGRWPEALRTYREVAEARARVLGPDLPDTLSARTDVSHCLDRLGRHAEAAALRPRRRRERDAG